MVALLLRLRRPRESHDHTVCPSIDRASRTSQCFASFARTIRSASILHLYSYSLNPLPMLGDSSRVGMLPRRVEADEKLLPQIFTASDVCHTSSLWKILENSCDTAEKRASIAVVDASQRGDVSFTFRALRLEARTLAHTLESAYAIKKGDSVGVLMENCAASIISAYAISALGARRVDINPSLTARETAACLAQADVRVVVATDPHANKLAHSLLEKALKYSALNDVDDRVSVLYAASPGGDLALPRYDENIRDFMDAMVESTRVSFDLHASAEGSDSAHSRTDGFDTFSSDSDECGLPLLQQLARGDALRWKPNVGDDVLLDSEYQGLFTSGTGGHPKLVFHTQRQVVAHAISVAECCKLSGKDVWLHVAPIAHAMDSFALYASVFTGATQVTMGSTAFNARNTIETIKRERVTAMALTRTHLQILLHEPSFAQAGKSLRMVSVGGSIIPASLVQRLQHACPTCTYFTDYGCTEACGKIATSLGETSHDPESLCRAGYPMPLFDVSVVKDTTSMTSVEWNDGDIGQVLVRGLTIGPKDNECWHVTGDLATVNSSGSLNIVDRISDLIVVGGENVRASEVESVMMQHDGIAECAVFSQPDVLLGEVVHAAFVSLPGMTPEVDDVLKFCSSRLADFKRPQKLFNVDSLPKTSTGKILKRELRNQCSSSRNSSVQIKSVDELVDVVYEEFSLATNQHADRDTAFASLGIHSVQAVQFARSLADRLGSDVPSTLMYDHPNLGGVIDALYQTMCKGQTVLSSPERRAKLLRKPTDCKVYVMSYSVNSPQRGTDSQSQLPVTRFDVDHRFVCGSDLPSSPLTSVSVRFANTIQNIYMEDADISGINTVEAAFIDPQHRLLLQQILGSSHWKHRVPDSSVNGVFVGCMWNDDFRELLSSFAVVVTLPNAALATGSGLDFLAGRIAFVCDWTGPAIGVNTACSSSLVTCGLGHGSLSKSQCDMAACSGTNLIISRRTHSMICRLNALAPDGRCKTLDATADGYGRAEAVATCYFSTCDTGQESLVAVAFNQDGRGSSLLAPRSSAQTAVIVEACFSSVNRVDAYELHGTGTQLGDPIEVGALFDASTWARANYALVAVGSVKSSIGHAEGAAGLMGLLGLLEELRRCKVEPIAHMTCLNPYIVEISVRHSQLHFAYGRTSKQAVSAERAEHAGVSAFGMSGTNSSALIQRSVGSHAIELAGLYRDMKQCSIQPRAYRSVHTFHRTNEQVHFHICVGRQVVAQLDLSTFVEVIHQACTTILTTVAGLQNVSLVSPLLPESHSSVEFDISLGLRLGRMRALAEDKSVVYAHSEITCVGRRAPDPPRTRNLPFNAMRKKSLAMKASSKPCSEDRAMSLESIFQLGAIHLQGHTTVSIRFCRLSNLPSNHMVTPRIALSGTYGVIENVASLSGPGVRRARRLPHHCAAGRQFLYETSWMATRYHHTFQSSACWYPPVTSARHSCDATSSSLMSVQTSKTVKSIISGMCVEHSSFSDDGHAMSSLLRTAAQELSNMRFASSQCEYTQSQYLTENAAWQLDLDAPAGSARETKTINRTVYEQRLLPVRQIPSRVPSRETSRSVLISGGTGGIGYATAKNMLSNQGTIHMYLLGRTGRRTFDARIERGDIQVMPHNHVMTTCKYESARRENIRYVIQSMTSPLSHVLHASGMIQDDFVSSQHHSGVKRVFAAKVDAFQNIDSATGFLHAVQSSVTFSSIASLFGSIGQCNYGAANAVVDCLVYKKHAHEGAAQANVQWGAWREIGMASRKNAYIRHIEAIGYGSIDPRVGLGVIAHLFAGWSPTSLVVSPFDWLKMSSTAPRSNLLRHVLPILTCKSTSNVEISEDEVQVRIRRLIKTLFGSDADDYTSMASLGLDSLLANDLKMEIDNEFGISSPVTLAYDFPTIKTLTDYIASALHVTPSRTDVPQKSTVASTLRCRKMIVGHQLQTSAHSDLPIDAISRTNRWRWDNEYWLDVFQNMFPLSAGFFEQCTMFDAALFGIAEVEALLLDPQQRMLLEASYPLANKMSARNLCSVFVGITSSEYKQVLHSHWGSLHNSMGTGNLPSVAAGRISYTFSLNGASLSVDTACSASLVACSLACNALDGQPDQVMALACGVVLMISAKGTIDRHYASMLSLDCRCKTLDESADGFIEGEAAGVMALEATSSRSFRGVFLSGATVNQDGRSASLTAPNGPSQQAVVRTALSQALLSSSDISGVSMHGTGTALGDPIELTAAISALRDALSLSFVATKSHIGHCETAAGLVSMVHAYKMIVLQNLQPILHLRTVNLHCTSALSTGATGARIIPRQVTYSRGHNVGVSAFAFQGTNAHAIQSSNFGGFGAEHNHRLDVLFERTETWPLPVLHPQLYVVSNDPDPGKIQISGKINPRWHDHLLDHIVNDQALYPGAGFQEICAASCRLALKIDCAIVDSIFPAPLSMSTDAVTTFEVTLESLSGKVMLSSNFVTHTQARVMRRRAQRRVHAKLRCDFGLKTDATATCFALLPRSRDEHLGYTAHPAMLDNALQLAAVKDMGNTQIKVPVGSGAYFSTSKSLFSSTMASVYGKNHRLHGAQFIELRVKTLRKVAPKTSSKAGIFKHAYEVKQFVVTSVQASDRKYMQPLVENRFSQSIAGTIETMQNLMCHVDSVALEGGSDSTSEAGRAVLRTAAQEMRNVQFKSIWLSSLRTKDANNLPVAQVPGVLHEARIDALVISETRLRHVANPVEKEHKFQSSRCGMSHFLHAENNRKDFVIITGGLGAVGMVTMRELSRNNWSVALLSRKGRANTRIDWRESLVVASKRDSSDPELTFDDPIWCVDQSAHYVFHAAGALQDALLPNQTVRTIFETIAAKRIRQGSPMKCLHGTLNCSSIAALTGNPGQANYAAANAMLDAESRNRRRFGAPETSVQWGGWADIGMAARDVLIVRRLERIGAGALDPRTGVKIIRAAFTLPIRRDLAVSPFNWQRISKALPAFEIFADVVRAHSRKQNQTSTAATPKPSQLTSQKTVQEVQSTVCSIIHQLVGRDIPLNAPLMEAGLDSHAASELKNELDGVFGIEVPVTVAYDYPTIETLSAYISHNTQNFISDDSNVSTSKSKQYSDVVAHISNAQLLVPAHSGDGITRIPAHRWDANWWWEREQLLIPSFSGFLIGYELFDASLFGIASIETLLMDVQQRSILEGVAVTRFGGNDMQEDGLEGDACGVYVAISSMQYQVEVLDHFWHQTTNPWIATGNTLSVAAGRVSFLFGLRGPCFSMDTACSSSIVATHLTVEGLGQGDCTSAHICGVISILGPGVTSIFYSSGMLSPSGRCKTLDAAADGYVRGEARGVFLVHRMDANSRTSGVAIIGSSINQDGRSSSLTAPNGPSQQAVMRHALKASGVSGAEVEKLQMHGTGTPLGDPIEVGATAAVLRRRNMDPLVLEAMKSAVGHTETASGMVALMQPSISLVHDIVQKILHLRSLNPHIASIIGKNEFVSVPRQELARHAKLAGVSSFAFQGTNANTIQNVHKDEDVSMHSTTSLAFEDERFYPLPILHPQLGSFSKRRESALYFVARVDSRMHTHLLHHCVLDMVLYPGAGFQELAGGLARAMEVSNFVVLNSSVPVPLQMSTTRSTLLEVKVLSTSGRLDMQNGVGNAVFMNCFIRPGVKNVYTPTTHFTFGEKVRHRCAYGLIRALDTDRHLDYVVNPGCLDNSLQLGAVMNAGVSEQLKIPVGVRAYASNKIDDKKRLLLARAYGFTNSYWLERVNVFGLQLKAMRRGHAKEVIKGQRTLYELFWLASYPCVPSTVQKTRVLVSSTSDAVLATMSSVQCNTASGININSIRTENIDAIHGLARTVGQEIKQLRTESVRFDKTRTRYVEAAKASLQFVGESYDVIVSGNMTYESRLHFASRTVAKKSLRSVRPISTRPRGTNRNVLITGGLGAIGKGYSEHVDADVENRVNLQLLGRSGRSKTFDGANLTNVFVFKCDSSFMEDVSSTLIYKKYDEIMHASGILKDMSLRKHTERTVRLVVCAKVDSWYKVEQYTSTITVLGRIVQCSSIAALTGSSGQSNYSAANACLDSIACSRRFRGYSMSSIQWGAWSNEGMANKKVLKRVESMGFGIVTPQLGMQVLSRVMSQWAIANVVATPYDFKKFVENMPIIPRVYRDLAVKRKKREKSSTKKTKARTHAGARSISDVRAKIKNIADRVIGREVSFEEPLMDAGLDSLSGQEMKSQIEEEFEIELPVTAAFDFPSVAALADYVFGEVGGSGAEEVVVENDSGVTIAHVKARVQEITSSVIGRDIEENEPLMDAGLDSLSGQEMKQRIEDEFEIDLPPTAAFDFPTVRDLAAFVADEIGAVTVTKKKSSHSSVAAAPPARAVVIRNFDVVAPRPPDADGIRCVPFHRWNHDFYQDAAQEHHSNRVIGYNLHIAPFSGFVSNYLLFDLHTFGISTLEALYMDVQQRSLLEGTLQSTAGSAHSHGDVLDAATSCTGVYVGIASCDYADEVLRRYEPVLHPYLVSGTSLNVAAGRISYVFNFRGPSVSVDTACSSSIVTTHTAASGMKSGEMARALSCGVQAILSEHITGVFHSSGMIAPDGRCKTLDSCADGYVRAEARGVLAMDTLSEDEMMNMHDVVVAGTAVNQDGRSSSLTAPNGPTQKVVIRTAASAAGVTTSSIGVLQLHGTGTALGDPIEVGAAVSVLERGEEERAPVLEAVKSHVGHAETAAGIVSIIHETQKLAKSSTSLILHLRLMSPHLEGVFLKTSKAVAHTPRQFCTNDSTLKSISGFAFQGTNANAILRLVSRDVSLGGQYRALFSRARFWPLPKIYAHLRTFDGSRDDRMHFTVCVEPRLHGHLLGYESKESRESLFPSSGFLELANAASRLFSCDSVACDAAVFTALPLLTNGIQLFTIAINAQSGSVEIYRDERNPHMRCLLASTSTFGGDDCISRRAGWLSRKKRTSASTVMLRLNESRMKAYLEYRIDPCCLESALSVRATSHGPGVLRACERYRTTEGDSPRHFSHQGVTCDGNFLLNNSRIFGAVFKKPFNRAVGSRKTTASTKGASRALKKPTERAVSLESIQAKIKSECARIVGSENVSGAEFLSEMGMDSLSAAELRAAIQNDFALTLPLAAAFECPTADALAAYVHREILKRRERVGERDTERAESRAESSSSSSSSSRRVLAALLLLLSTILFLLWRK